MDSSTISGCVRQVLDRWPNQVQEEKKKKKKKNTFDRIAKQKLMKKTAMLCTQSPAEGGDRNR